MKTGFHKINVDILPGHCRNLADGRCVTLKPHMVGRGIPIVVHHTTAKKIMKAHKAGKGHRLMMSPEEIEMSGGKLTWKGFKRGLKKGWDWYKKNLAPALGPLIQKGLKSGVSALSAVVPEFAPFAGAADSLVNKLGDTGLYGDRGSSSSQPTVAASSPPTTSTTPAPTPSPAPAPQKKSKLEGAGVRRRKKTAPKRKTAPKQMQMPGYGLYAGDPYSTGMGLYAGNGLYAGGSIYAPSNFIPTYSPAFSPLASVGNTQWGQRLIPLPL